METPWCFDVSNIDSINKCFQNADPPAFELEKLLMSPNPEIRVFADNYKFLANAPLTGHLPGYQTRGITNLMVIAARNYLPLLKKKIDELRPEIIFLQDDTGKTAIHYAYEADNLIVLTNLALADKGKFNLHSIRDNNGVSVYSIFVKLQFMVDDGDVNIYLPLDRYQLADYHKIIVPSVYIYDFENIDEFGERIYNEFILMPVSVKHLQEVISAYEGRDKILFTSYYGDTIHTELNKLQSGVVEDPGKDDPNYPTYEDIINENVDNENILRYRDLLGGLRYFEGMSLHEDGFLVDLGS